MLAKKIIGLFEPVPKLAEILNKSRLFNTYLSIFEILMMIFYNIIPAKTNQNPEIFQMNLIQLTAITCHMYIHAAVKLPNYTKSCQLNFCVSFMTMYRTSIQYDLFLALS